MEERLIDKDDERLIRIKKTADGVDAQDVLAEETESSETEEEVFVEIPEDEEYDEDLVGLTPTELKREQERRKKAEEEARAECEKLVKQGEEELARGEFKRAESFFSQADCYAFADERITKGLWTARTKDFTDTSPFYNLEFAEDFSASDDASKRFVREKAESRLAAEREEFLKEEKEIAPAVLEKQEERRQAFAQNKKYYKVRFLGFLAGLILFGIAVSVSAYYIVRTLSSAPVILTGIFGGLALVAFVGMLVYFLKTLGADKLCKINEKLSSTEDGKRLEELREKLECLRLVLENEADEKKSE